jgi:hypothetical protein
MSSLRRASASQGLLACEGPPAEDPVVPGNRWVNCVATVPKKRAVLLDRHRASEPLFDRAKTWMLAHKVLLPGATPLEHFVAKLQHRVELRLWRVLASGMSSADRPALRNY